MGKDYPFDTKVGVYSYSEKSENLKKIYNCISSGFWMLSKRYAGKNVKYLVAYFSTQS